MGVLSSNFLEMFPREDLVAIVALVRVISYSEIGPELGGVEVCYTC